MSDDPAGGPCCRTDVSGPGDERTEAATVRTSGHHADFSVGVVVDCLSRVPTVNRALDGKDAERTEGACALSGLGPMSREVCRAYEPRLFTVAPATKRGDEHEQRQKTTTRKRKPGARVRIVQGIGDLSILAVVRRRKLGPAPMQMKKHPPRGESAGREGDADQIATTSSGGKPLKQTEEYVEV